MQNAECRMQNEEWGRIRMGGGLWNAGSGCRWELWRDVSWSARALSAGFGRRGRRRGTPADRGGCDGGQGARVAAGDDAGGHDASDAEVAFYFAVQMESRDGNSDADR